MQKHRRQTIFTLVLSGYLSNLLLLAAFAWFADDCIGSAAMGPPMEAELARLKLLLNALILLISLVGAALLWRIHLLQGIQDQQATRDFLTGAVNRRHFCELAQRHLLLRRRGGKPLVLAILDLDHFKTVNDRYGHPVGDIVLKSLCTMCAMSLRESDVIGRLGGEEFAILMPDTDLDTAAHVIERVRRLIASTPIAIGAEQHIRITASIGVASAVDSTDTVESILARADQLLYQAKAAGRDQVRIDAQATPAVAA